LVIDPSFQIPIGMSHVDIWNRKWNKLTKYERDYKKQGIKEKNHIDGLPAQKGQKNYLQRLPA